MAQPETMGVPFIPPKAQHQNTNPCPVSSTRRTKDDLGKCLFTLVSSLVVIYQMLDVQCLNHPSSAQWWACIPHFGPSHCAPCLLPLNASGSQSCWVLLHPTEVTWPPFAGCYREMQTPKCYRFMEIPDSCKSREVSRCIKKKVVFPLWGGFPPLPLQPTPRRLAETLNLCQLLPSSASALA